MDKIMIGIDFGTTNTSITYMKYNNEKDAFAPECFSFIGQNYVKTLITYMDRRNYWIGVDALNRAFQYPDGFIKSIKRKVVNKVEISNAKLNIPTVEVVSDILKQLRDQIMLQLPLDTEIDGVVMGIPVGFTDANKDLYLHALVRSGFYKDYKEAYDKSIFVAEPIAAVLDYNLSLKDDKKVLVFDFGGGTLDLVVMEMKNIVSKNEIKEHEVISKGGIIKLGGDDFDRVILEELVAAKYGKDELKMALGISKFDEIMEVKSGIELMKEIQRAKEELSRVAVTDISMISGNLNMHMMIKREELELAIKPFMIQITKSIISCLEAAYNGKGMKPQDIDVVVLAGGSSLVPLVQETLFDIFGRNKVKVSGDPMTSISRGLALRGHNTEKHKYADILEHSYGIKIKDENKIKITRTLKCGQSIKDVNLNDYFEEFILEEYVRNKDKFKVTVCEDDTELDTVFIPFDKYLMADSKFKLFFVIDENLEKLELEIWDTSRDQKVDIPIGERYISLKNRAEAH